MSADPDAPADPKRQSGGHVVRNMIYAHDGNHNLEIVTGWADQGLREYDQDVVRPAKRDLPASHPCYQSNADLLRCSLACPPEMKLGGRTATCNAERHVLMRCVSSNRRWEERQQQQQQQAEAPAWYRFW